MSDARRCPVCGRPAAPRDAPKTPFPFCSPRCQSVDLGRWLNEDYVISEPVERPDARPSDGEDDD